MSKNGNHIETFHLRTCDCDLAGTWRPSALLEAMQETAIAHCDRLDFGRAVTDGLGVAWVLSRLKVALERVPAIGEAVSVETWPIAPRHLFYPRMFTLRDGAGGVIGHASSLWVLMDLNARRITDRPEARAAMPDNRDVPLPIPLPGTPRPLEGEPLRGELTPGCADFDINGHVNNTRYMDWCVNALGLETLKRRQLTAFEVNYEGEIRDTQPIQTELWLDGDHFCFAGSAQGRRAFAVSGALEDRGDEAVGSRGNIGVRG